MTFAGQYSFSAKPVQVEVGSCLCYSKYARGMHVIIFIYGVNIKNGGLFLSNFQPEAIYCLSWINSLSMGCGLSLGCD